MFSEILTHLYHVNLHAAMKKILLLLLSVITLINCTPLENEMRLTGFVKGMKEGTLLLQKSENNTFKTIDSMVVKGDAYFNFSEINFIRIYFPFILPVRKSKGTVLFTMSPFVFFMIRKNLIVS